MWQMEVSRDGVSSKESISEYYSDLLVSEADSMREELYVGVGYNYSFMLLALWWLLSCAVCFKLRRNNIFRIKDVIHCVPCAGLSDVHGASQYVVSAHTAGALGKLKAIHSVIT
jgi:hypothetical protein